jgi:hypothetical protein
MVPARAGISRGLNQGQRPKPNPKTDRRWRVSPSVRPGRCQSETAKSTFCDGHHIAHWTTRVACPVRDRIRGSTRRKGASHAQIWSCCCSGRGRRRLWVDRLNEGACCSSYGDEQSHYRAHEDDGRFGEFAHRAFRRLFAHLPVSAARIRLRTALLRDGVQLRGGHLGPRCRDRTASVLRSPSPMSRRRPGESP